MSDFRRMLSRAERSFGDCSPNRLTARVRAIVGNEGAMPATAEGRKAAAALQKLKRGDEPTAAELAALEFMIRLTRPAPPVRSGRPDALPRPEQRQTFPDWRTFQEALIAPAASIGRVDRAVGRSRTESLGTCFQIDEERVLTNRHVLEQLSRGTLRLERGMGVVRFQQELGRFAKDEPFDIVRVDRIHPKLDAALLRITKRPRVVLLTWDSRTLREDADVVVVGYPVEDSANNPLFIEQIFQNQYGILRAAPGLVVEKLGNHFRHDCSTLQGNSGSPVLCLKSGKVVGLHLGGAFLWSNDAATGKSLREFTRS